MADQTAKTSKQVPSMGRIVLLNHRVESIDDIALPQLSPAIILRVEDDGFCDLGVWTHGGYQVVWHVREGDDINHWHWPPRV